MCGIAGWIGAPPGEEGIAERMLMALRHRGPDSQGIRSWREATLLHTRLSIIDLSSTGAQPIANEDGTVWAVFNGEIYNHRELRLSLEARGHRFRGRSDSEVLPHLYEEDGPGFISKLRGMFALAIFDTRTKTLILARDRFGIKPLYYAPGSERLAFASEIGALLRVPGVDTQPDRQAVYDFAALFYIPAPETFYMGIRAVQAGEILEARFSGDTVLWKTRRYHRWSIAPDSEMAFAQAVDQTEALVSTAVRRQMESDVPLGALLSGGIDSSLVSAAAQSALGGGLRTFNVRFSEGEYDETWAATSVANHIGSDHTTLDMDGERGTWERVTELLLHAGQPFTDTSLFAMNAISRLIRRKVSVVLSGDGGDEGFCGYDVYWRIARIARLQKVAPMVWCFAAALSPLAHAKLVPTRLPHRLRELAGADDISIIQDLFSWIHERELARLCLDEGKVLPIRRLFEPQWDYDLGPSASRVERLSAYATEANVRLALPNDFLFKVDIASMKESLEVRVPMLDEDLFEFGLRLPYHLNVKGQVCKRVLRGVAGRCLPSEVATKPKLGFGVPMETWLSDDFKQRMKETLLGSSSKLAGFFRPEAYANIVKSFCESSSSEPIPRRSLCARVIMLLSVQLALERNV